MVLDVLLVTKVCLVEHLKRLWLCPHIAEALADFCEKFPGITLDGELYNLRTKARLPKDYKSSKKN